ncbi:MAG: peptidoglycan DD-metalloendopeptidase family protein, partial [Myxococcales bacterium]|nr:peptidoglycan DD-metalloendopeptidase family protein [Myxococcales bacterium]
LLAAMLLIESGGDEAARSPSGAAGLMQLMPETARRIAKARGLDAPTDEAIFDPELNLDFGAWYLARQLERFEDPRLAVAAYNAGPARVVAHVERGQRLPDESRRYADQVIALWSERSEATSPTLTGLFERTRAQLRGRMKAPVDLSAVRLGFGENAHPIRKVPFEHQGIDVPQAEGTSVQAALRGVVRSVDAKGTADARGRYIVLQHGRLETRYYHLAAVRVAVGQQVEAGEVIGEVGNSGVSTGPHLHFEVREMGTPVDPGLYYDLGR